MFRIKHCAAALAMVALSCTAAAAPEGPSREAMFSKMSALASTGNAEVLYNLGMFLNNGIGTPADHTAAFRRFSEAAAAGHALAAFKVGCYLMGQFPGTVPVDAAEGLKFKLRAAEAGYDLAQQDVALHYARTGEAATAQRWFERASHQGDLPSTAYLADQLSRPGSADKHTGYALLQLLQARMPQPPKELLERMATLEGTLSADDKAAAAALRDNWVTAPSPLTLQARAGLKGVPALIASLEH